MLTYKLVMKKVLLLVLFILINVLGFSQINLLVENIDYTMTTHNGYEIARTNPTNLIFRYSRITTSMNDGFMLMAGDNDYSASTATNLDGAQIYGARFIGTLPIPSGSLHALMVGYNQNYDIHHNFINSYDYGITHEGGFTDHTSMSNILGGIYYNILKNNNYSIVEKGYNGTRIYGNTFYSDLDEPAQFIGIKQSDTGGLPAPYPNSSNTKIKNNIFYYAGSFSQYHAIKLGAAGDDTPAEMDTVGFESDYNIYYWENTVGNKPFFEFNGSTLTWEQWRALGYDEHSIILNPNFINTTDFIPTTRLDYGTVLTGFEQGLASTSSWVVGSMPQLATQNGTWQVGAKIYAAEEVPAGTFFVSPFGNDSNPGTFSQPWATWGKAFNSTAVQPGDTVYFRGGIYQMTSNDLAYPGTLGSGYDVTRDGTSTNTIKYWAYPGETPILDCSNVTGTGNNYGIMANDVSYVHFRGLTVRNVKQRSSSDAAYGWIISGDHITLEYCVAHNNGGMGFNSLGHEIYYLNCDAYNNCDSLSSALPGNDGVGFTNKDLTNVDGSIYYKNCRAWKNGDQGFSAISVGYLEFEGCWSFNNGLYQGEGHGFKMGAVGLEGSQPPFGPLKRKYINNIAAFNRANGWTTNDNTSYLARTMHIFNNIAYHNGYPGGYAGVSYGFIIYNTASVDAEELARIYRNNISYHNEDGATLIPAGSLYTHSNNTWDLAVTVSDADFVSIDSTGLTASRGEGGSLPNINFLKLAEGSDLIDAGIDVGLPYAGTAPDLGFHESDGPALSDATDIITFTFPSQTGSATINTTLHTVTIEVNYLADITNLSPTITLSTGATINPLSGITRNFSSPVTYAVTAEDSVTTQIWTITVTQSSTPIMLKYGTILLKSNINLLK
jgi:hypothetical protein